MRSTNSRMYWAKKILEWSRSAAEAYDVCVRMNDRYELDGPPPPPCVHRKWSASYRKGLYASDAPIRIGVSSCLLGEQVRFEAVINAATS